MRIPSGLLGIGPGPGPADTPETIAACGENPCGSWDYVYLTDSCMNYLGCADPTNGLYVGAKKGALYLIGQTAAQAVGSVGAGAASGISTPVFLIGVALGLVVLFAVVEKK